jgi:pyruvate ferredoxin oxidoreductase gamma subunit
MVAVNVTSGLKDSGMVVANTSKAKEELIEKFNIKQPLYVVDANKIAMEEIGRPITNTTMMGALVKATNLVALSSIEEQIEHRFPAIAEKNIKALRRAYEETQT